jgi:hypothetical protein
MDISEYLVKYPVAFVAVSFGNDPDLIATIVTAQAKLPIQKAYVVSFEGERCKRALKDMKQEDVKVICYNDIEMGDLHGVKNSVIGFDNLSYLLEFAELDMKRGFDIVEYLKKNGNWIIIFGTQKTLPVEIKKFEDYYPKAHLFDDRFANFGHNVVYSLNKVTMSKTQELRYNISEKYWYETRKIVPDKTSWRKDTYSNLKKFCNIVYPGSIQSMFESTTIEEKNKVPSAEEIIGTFGIGTILENAPKFQQLVDNIVITRRQRHLVHTAYSNYFGTGIIAAILRSLEIPTLVLDYEQSSEKNEENLKLFNTTEKYIVLVTNIIPPEDPINIHMYHIIDSELLKSFEILFQIYKYKNYKVESTKAPKLAVELYSCSKLESKSIDDIMFEEFYPFLTQQQKFWDMVVNSAMHIVTNDKYRLSVVL